jgi:NhaA family Na+:H+ antiporter
LANAGVPLNLSDFKEPVATAVMAGLILGKPTGIVLFSWLAISTGIARLPKGVTWPILGAGGLLAGIGFTMAIFIAGLALKDELLNASKVGILAASSVCALLGVGLLFWLIPKHNPDSAQTN